MFNPNSEDDDIIRKHWLLKLQLYAIDTFQEVEMIAIEDELLKHKGSRPKSPSLDLENQDWTLDVVEKDLIDRNGMVISIC